MKVQSTQDNVRSSFNTSNIPCPLSSESHIIPGSVGMSWSFKCSSRSKGSCTWLDFRYVSYEVGVSQGRYVVPVATPMRRSFIVREPCIKP